MNLITKQLNIFTSPTALPITSVIRDEQVRCACSHLSTGGSDDAINEKNKL